MRQLRNYVTIKTVYFLACSMFFNLPQMIVLANPTGGAFTHGTGTITEGPTTTIVTDQTRTSIDWATFNISGGNSVIFDQPTANSATLNRINQGSPSEINGTLIGIVAGDMGNIGGRILLINPDGVIFGSGSSVNATQVTAAALNMTPQQVSDWVNNGALEGTMGAGIITLENGVTVNVAEGLVLVGDKVINSSTINVSGYVVMAAGDQVTIVNPGSPNTSVVLDAGTIANEIRNQSSITAGGKILLAAAGDIFSAALTASGSVTLDGAAILSGNIIGDGITFTNTVTAVGGTQKFDATTGTLQAENIIKTGTGTLTLGGDMVVLNDAVEVQAGQVRIASGGIVQNAYVYNDAALRIPEFLSGGSGELTISNVYAYDNSTVDIFSGNIGNLNAFGSSSIIFWVKDFVLGEGLWLVGNELFGTGILSGQWFDGSEWTTEIETNFQTATILLICEPFPSVLYVDANNSEGPWNGTQSNPYQYIQDAINIALQGTKIVVLPGTYLENISVINKDIETTSVNPDDSSIVEATIIDGQFVDSVLVITDSSVSIIGLKIVNGYGDLGGGLRIADSDVSISNSIISNNFTRNISDWGDTTGSGGGLHISSNSEVSLYNSTISYNSTGGDAQPWDSSPVHTGSGGGIYSAVSDLYIERCIIKNNSTSDAGHGYPGADAGHGGGVFAHGGNLLITHTEIANNFTGAGGRGDDMLEDGGNGGRGGGIYSVGSNSFLVSNSVIRNNRTGSGGYGGWECWGDWCPTGGDGGHGGGVYAQSGTIENCTFVNNQTGSYGCAYYCGVAGNGGAIYGEIYLKNSIVHNNQIVNIANVAYSNIQGGHSGVGNIDTDPLFADPSANDFHLKSQYGRWSPSLQSWVFDDVTSPCIDAGDPSDDGWKNELWPHGKRINMGAYGGTPESSMSASMKGNIADINLDSVVDLLDFSLLARRWQNEVSLIHEDLSRNNIVSLEDICIFAENWLQFIFEPIGYWKFNEMGPTVHDSSGFENHGIMRGGVFQDNCGSGTFEFFGGGYVEIPNSDLLIFENGITISTWIYLYEYGTNQWPKVIIKPHTAYSSPWEMFTLDLGRNGTHPRFIITDGIDGGQLAIADGDSATLNLEQWYHIVGAYDGTTISIYIDGQLVASSPVDPTIMIGTNNSPLFIGSREGLNPFTGAIDEVRIFNHGIDLAKVQELYAMGSDEFVLQVKIRQGHGTVTPEFGNHYYHGENVEMEVIPNLGWKVKRWVGTENDFSTSNTNIVTMTSDKTVMVDLEESSRSGGRR